MRLYSILPDYLNCHRPILWKCLVPETNDKEGGDKAYGTKDNTITKKATSLASLKRFHGVLRVEVKDDSRLGIVYEMSKKVDTTGDQQTNIQYTGYTYTHTNLM